jgi:glutamate N-acetyltransferase/amino-acid N-acetyltransferase
MTQNTEAYAVPGFLANGIHAGIKQDSMKDLALIFSTVPAKVSALFTKNRIKAAPVLLDMERVKTGLAQAIVANSGNANAATGPAGYGDAVEMSKIVSQRLHINDELVLVASTGVIGHRIPLDNIRVGMNELVEGLHQEGVRIAAEAIMTTDKYSKMSCRKGFLGSKEITVCGIAKGAGMIEPHMATMLAFVITDADIDSRVLKTVFRGAADRSFNAITVDGCMSTNDTAIILANGVAGNKRLTSSSANTSLFREMLCHVMSDLALDMIRDGEGATKVIDIFVDEAKSVADAKRVAYAIANSNLVKTAFYGCDPNWGRIMAAAGSAGVQFPIDGVTLYIENIPVFSHGCRTENHEKELAEIMKRKEIKVHLLLGMGNKAYRVCASDLSMEYIRINAHYHT